MDDSNIVQMCREHHTEQHKIGWFSMCIIYVGIAQILYEKGWEFKDLFGVKKLVKKDG